MAALDGDEPQRAGHVLVHDREDPLGCLLGRAEPHRVRDGLHRCAGGIDVERHLSTEKARRQMPEDDVGVGHGRLRAAAPVRRRTGIRAGRLWAYPERLGELRHMGDGSAAGADRVHVHRRDLDPEVADRGLAPNRRLAVLAERDVGRGAAHVEGEDVLEARLAGDVERAGDATRGTGEDPVDRVAPCLDRGHETGVRAEDVDVRGGANAVQLRLEILDVRRDLGSDVRVHARGQRPLVLAELRQHLCRERHREARVEPLDDLADPLLVRRVDVRVDQPDRERLDARFDQVAHNALDLRLVDLDDGLAARTHALDRLARVRERGGRVGLLHDDPARERAGGLRTGEVQDLREPLGRDQSDAGALRLEHRVRRDGRAVQDVPEVTDVDARLLADPADADEHAL